MSTRPRSTSGSSASRAASLSRGTRSCRRRCWRRSTAGSRTRIRPTSSGELIRYLEHPRSGALEFDDMGPSWVPVRNAVADGTLRATNPGAADVAGRFDALLRFAALQLSTRLGTEATVVYSRKELADPASRIAAHVATLVDHGRLQGAAADSEHGRHPRLDRRPPRPPGDLQRRHRRPEGGPADDEGQLAGAAAEAEPTNEARLECNVMNQRGGSGASELLGTGAGASGGADPGPDKDDPLVHGRAATARWD